MSAKYYTRSLKEMNPKKWDGPFEIPELQNRARRKLFSKELHEVSEDRVSWIPAKQIWSTIFPKVAPVVIKPDSKPASRQGSASHALSHPEPSLVPNDTSNNPSAGSDVGAESWYYAFDEVQQGPVTFKELQEFAAQGQLQGEDLVWNPQLGNDWIEASAVTGLFSQEFLQPMSATGGAPRGAAGQGIQPLALASFIFGLLGTCILPGIGNILAIVFGHLSLAQFNRREGSMKGRRFAVAGLVLGYAMIVTAVLLSMLFIVITLFAKE